MTSPSARNATADGITKGNLTQAGIEPLAYGIGGGLPGHFRQFSGGYGYPKKTDGQCVQQLGVG